MMPWRTIIKSLLAALPGLIRLAIDWARRKKQEKEYEKRQKRTDRAADDPGGVMVDKFGGVRSSGMDGAPDSQNKKTGDADDPDHGGA